MPTEVPYTESGADRSRRTAAGGLQANPSFDPLLACYDLTRTGTLPASDGCPNSTSGPYTFNGHANIRELALYIQDTITLKNWTFNLGVRGDYLQRHHQSEPGGAAAGHRVQHQADQHRAAGFLCPHARNAVQREPGAGEPGLQRSRDQRPPGGHPGLSVPRPRR